jgi:AraC family transcriptional regulator
MHDRSWTRLNDGQMQVFVRHASFGRFWTGFDAYIYDTLGGFTEAPPFNGHVLRMHVGAPIRATCRCDSTVSRRLQVPGDIDLIPFGHAGACEDHGPTSLLVVYLTPSIMRTAAEEIDVNPDRITVAPQLQLRDPRIEHIGCALKAELEAEEPTGRLYADGLGLALAAHLLRQYAPLVAPITNGLPKRRLQRVMDYIRDHLADDLTLAELAATAQISASHFKSLFKQSVGVPVHQYVIRTRVEYAIELLTSGDLPLSDIALQAGFANQSHMARCMRRVTGMTPSIVRNGN